MATSTGSSAGDDPHPRAAWGITYPAWVEPGRLRGEKPSSSLGTREFQVLLGARWWNARLTRADLIRVPADGEARGVTMLTE